MSCSLEEIKEGCDAKAPVVRVQTPEWPGDGYVFVRGMFADEAGASRRFDIENASEEEQETAAIIGWCILGVCDEDGNRLLEDDARTWLGKSLLAPVLRCAQATMKLNGTTEDLVGNSDESQTDDSPSS